MDDAVSLSDFFMLPSNRWVMDRFPPELTSLIEGGDLTNYLTSLPPDSFTNYDDETLEESSEACDQIDPTMPRLDYKRSHTDLEKEARERSTDLFSKHAQLKGALERHEALIRKRWCKKTPDQREKLLKSVMLDIPKQHRPDQQAVGLETREVRRSGCSKYLGRFMCPSINLEDLLPTKSLLLFLNSRGRHPLHAFVFADWEALQPGFSTGALRISSMFGHTMLFYGQTTPETYGQTVPWYHNPRALGWCASGFGVHPGSGIWVLQAQQGIMDFLLDCCRKILHDQPQDFLDENIPIQPEPEPVAARVTSWQSLATLAAEAPYRVPADLDFDRIRSIIAAKITATKDHVLALREDPGYFEEYVKEFAEHAQENIPDVKGRKDPQLGTMAFWKAALSLVIDEAYGSLFTWKLLHRQAGTLAKMKKKYALKIERNQRLPKDYEEEIRQFILCLDKIADAIAASIKKLLPGSPNARSLFIRDGPFRDDESNFVGPKFARKMSPLIMTLEKLCDEGTRAAMNFPMWCDYLARLLNRDPSQRKFLSGLIAQYLADLSIVGECTRQLDLYLPWITPIKRKNDGAGTQQAFIKAQEPLEDVRTPMSLTSWELGLPTHGRFSYPVGKRRSRETVEAMRAAEKKLDAFWDEFDNCITRAATSPSQFTLRALVGDFTIQRTPEWTPPAEDEVTRDTRKDPSGMELPYRPFPAPAHAPEDRAHRLAKEDQPVERTKIKTRGTPNPSEDAPPITHVAAPERSAAIEVPKRALKTFSFLFSIPSAASPSGGSGDGPAAGGELPWADFLHAMSSAGFGVEKMYGSAWQFTPTNLDVERSISFHEPHPIGKLSWWVARRYGRRLNRAYGWDGASFALDEKVGGE